MHYRPDIDGLRALAVLAVVAFHAFPVWLKGGFIGVDIFFVISGYLISTIIFNNLDRNTFSFSDFYQRRIRRIFPALLLVLTISLSLGWFTLLADEYHQLGKHVFAGTAFISNFVLWAESGYFDNAANTKPLLHLWSLGIEEQFYLIWPILVWLAWHKKWVTLLIIFIFVLSFILNTVIINYDSVATFYSPFTRFWELSSGSLLAWITFKKRLEPSILPQPVLETISFIGLGILGVAVLIINKNDSFPGWWALLPVSGTMLLIYVGNRAWINHIFLSNKLLVWFGLISFPLYLWHWPIISFGTIAEGELPSTTFRIFAVLISIFLAWVTYRYIEKPIRSGKGSKYITILSTLAILVGLSGSAVSLNNGLAQRSAVIESDFTEKVRRQFMGALWEYTSNNTCLNEHPFKLSKSLSWWFCMKNSSGSPNIIILGTSYANQLYPGFVNNPLLKHHTVLSIGTCDIVGNKIQIFKPDHPCYREKQKIQQQFIDSIIDRVRQQIKKCLIQSKLSSTGSAMGEARRLDRTS